jgi:hypothetical protein
MELERGRGLQAATRERLLTEALENLQSDLDQAAHIASNEARQRRSEKNEASPEELLAELSELRRAWQLAQANAEARARGERGFNGDPGNGGYDLGGGGQNANLGGYGRHWIEGDRGRLNGWSPPLASGALRPGAELPEFREQAEEISRRLRDMLNRMPRNSLPPADISALRQLANQLRRSGKDPMESEYKNMTTLVDQLELAALSASEKNREDAATRTETPTADSPEYRETVAEYYRRLGGTK